MQDRPEELAASSIGEVCPCIDFDQASRLWRANKTTNGSVSNSMQYYRCVGDDVFVNAGTCWRRGHIVRVKQNSADVKTKIGTIRGIREDRTQIRCWTSTEFVERRDADGYDHRPFRRRETRILLSGEQVPLPYVTSTCALSLPLSAGDSVQHSLVWLTSVSLDSVPDDVGTFCIHSLTMFVTFFLNLADQQTQRALYGVCQGAARHGARKLTEMLGLHCCVA